MSRKLSLKPRKQLAVVINRVAFKDKKLVYIATTNRKWHYPLRRSRIVYIGTTKKGAKRIAESAVRIGK